MADNEIFNLDEYMIGSYADLEEILEDVQKHLIRLGKRIRVALDALPSQILKKLKELAMDTASFLDKAFTVDSLEDYEHIAAVCGEELANSLLQLQLSFLGLQNAVIAAAAPIAQVLVPVIQAAVDALTGLANSIGYVLRTLLLGQEAADNFSDSLTGVSSAAKSVKRTLAGFDQINRLGSSASSGSFLNMSTVKPLTKQWEKLSQQLLAFLEPLQKIDLTPAAKSLERLREALQPITRTLLAGLEWAWYNLFVPLAQWTVEELLPVFLDTLTAALQALGKIIEELKPAFTWLWENCLKPLAEWAGDQVIDYLKGIICQLTGVSDWVHSSQGPVNDMITAGKDLVGWLTQVAAKTMSWSEVNDTASASIGRVLTAILSSQLPMDGTISSIGLVVDSLGDLASAFGLVDTASGTTWDALQQVWKGAWIWLKEKTMDPTYKGVKDTLNGIIDLINSLLRGLTSGLNFVSRSMNKLGFKLPDWLPIVGGKRVSFGLQEFTTPQIPKLAQGAVLPANKPFLAMVGDQKHGTNIEAPLETIQEAVGVVMEDMIASNMAGHEATVSVLREILQAVLGISIGDDVIAGAVDRHNRKMAMVWGG